MGNMKSSDLLKPWRGLVLSLAIFAVSTLAGRCAPGLNAGDLRCEYGRNPTAVGETQPRLSWVVEAGNDRRGVVQAAYQVLVADSLQSLKLDRGEVWDSGKVSSDQSIQVPYAGKALASGQTCYWKVKLWDQEGHASAWSAPAQWTMGLLRASDWQAKWIGYQAPAPGAAAADLKPWLSLDGCSWVWANEAKAGDQPAGKAYLRKVIEIPAGRTLRQAAFLLTADDEFRLFVNGHSAGEGTTWRTVFNLEVTGRMQPGANVLAIEATNGGDTPSPAGVIGRLVLLFASGEPMIVAVDSSWLTSRQAGGDWKSAQFDAAAWKPASPVAAYGASPWGKVKTSSETVDPAPFFRKAFTVAKPIKHASIYASALGVYELHLNGKPVDNDLLSPGWTDYRKRVHYLGYDVTRQLKQGSNVIGAILGDGWYAGYLAFTEHRHYYGDKTRFIAQLQIQYEDGSSEVIGTDESWKATTGPILEGDLLMGCVYDARKELPAWDAAAGADANWTPATVDATVKANLEAHPGTPIRRMLEVTAKRMTEPQPGVYVFDLGQNMVGHIRLLARGEAGRKVVVRHVEMLKPDGMVYTDNLRAAKATDTFYLAGGPQRAYEPYFTFHGFQYVEITGLDYKPDIKDVVGIVTYSDLPQTAWFECSEPLVNKLTLNSLWGQRGNFLDVPTDCPQRDERAGWTGDAQVFMKTACLNLDAPAFYTKWLTDLCEDSQRADGGFGDVAPHISIVGYGNTGWSDSGPICNWRMFEMYGDTRVLQRHYDALVRHSDYLAKTSKGLVRGTLSYGDWLRLAGPQHSDVIGTAYYFYTSRVMARIAEALGKTQDAAKYTKLAEDIRGVFVKNYLKPDGRIIDGKNETGQTFYALAFGLELVPAELKDQVAARFVESIAKEHDHLATGFLGTPFVLFALQKAGHPELAYKLVLNKTYPSWLQQVIWGSTTMWERWDGWRPDKGFQDAGMNSFNHYWLGCVSEWLITQAAGIDTDGPAYKRITIHPEIVPAANGFTWVKSSYQSLRGKVASAWKVDNGRFQLEVTIPANSTAAVYVPAAAAGNVTEGGQPATQAKGVKFLRQEGGLAVFEVGSGHYQFEAK